MKKSKLLIVSSSIMLALGLGLSIAHNGVQKVEAATFVNETLSDDFATGIDAEKFDVVDSEDKVGLVQRNGVLRFGHMDYNVGWVHNSELINRGTGSVVFQFNQISTHSGWLCFTFSDSYSWPNMIMSQLHLAQALPNGGAQTASLPQAEGTLQWFAGKDNLALRVRIVWNNDGSASISVSQDSGASFLEVMNWPASTYTIASSGYVGFYGNGLTDTVDLDSVKIGVASNSTLADLSWVVEDEFEEANDGKFVADNPNAGNVFFEQLGGVNAVMLNNPASGSGIITKASYSMHDTASDTLFDARLDLDITELGEKAIGLGFGLQGEVTDAQSAYFVGVREVASQKELVLLNNGSLVKKTDITDMPAQHRLALSVMPSQTGFALKASFGSDILEEDGLSNVEGKIAITVSGEGTTVAKVLGLQIKTFMGVIETGRDTSIGSSFNHNWLVENGTNGSISMDNTGLINFKSAADNTRLQTRFRYVNFDLQFDARMQQLDEDADPIILPSTWLGVSFGRTSTESNYWDSTGEMLYVTSDTVNSITTQDGHTPGGVATSRGWFTAEYLPLSEANNNVMFHYHITATNGRVSFAVSRDGGAEVEMIIYEGMQTDGYIAFSGTAGANYFLKNIQLVNTDGEVVENNAPVVEDGTLGIYKGQTKNAAVVATDDDAYDADYLTYEVVNDNTTSIGTLTFNADGTYSFEATAIGTGTFVYRAFDSEDYSQPKTITITVTEDPLVLYKNAAKGELDAWATDHLDDYRAEEQALITDGIAKAKTQIDAAATTAEVDAIMEQLEVALGNLKTKAQYEAEEAEALATAKTNAKAELESYKNAADYREAEQAQLATIVAQGKDAIDAATDIAGVNAALAAAKAQADALKTKAQYEAEESQQQPGETTPTETPAEEPAQTAKKKCGGSIVASSIIVSTLALAGVGLLSFRRKNK